MSIIMVLAVLGHAFGSVPVETESSEACVDNGKRKCSNHEVKVKYT